MTWPDRIGVARIAAYILVALLVLFVVLPQLEALFPDARHDALVIQNTNAWIKGDHARAARVAHLQARSDSFAALARGEHSRAATERASRLALAADLVRAQTAADSVPILVRMVVKADAELAHVRTENGELWHTHLADSTQIVDLNADLADAMRHLRATVAVADCRWLNLSWAPKCLGRKASAVAGVGLGVALMLVVHR